MDWNLHHHMIKMNITVHRGKQICFLALVRIGITIISSKEAAISHHFLQAVIDKIDKNEQKLKK